jgi:hypothetical protein
MPFLGPEYRGKLPPGRAGPNRRALESYRNAVKLGVLKGVEILPGPGCPVSEAQMDVVYTIESVPALPLTGCNRSPCYGCCYSPETGGNGLHSLFRTAPGYFIKNAGFS